VTTFRLHVIGRPPAHATFWVAFGPLADRWGLIQLHAAGGGSLQAVAVVAGDGEPLLPCGRCRQLLLEAGGGSLLVDTAEGPAELSALLPAAFSGTDLAAHREE